MKIETFNTLNLIPIGKVSFVFDRRIRPTKEKDYVYVGDVTIMQETDRNITPETYKAVLKMMKDAKSDLLTDGRNFFTTRGEIITQIKHETFDSILKFHKENGVDINILLHK